MPVIPATWEAKIRKIPTPGQLEQKIRHYFKNKQSKKGLEMWLK
jgi:hypothetical protein